MPDCLSPIRLVPGPQGPAGAAGVNGTNGTSSFTTTTAAFTMPAIAATAVASVAASGGFTIGQAVHLQGAGTLIVTALPTATSITLQNPTGYAANVAGGTVIGSGAKLGPSGVIGPSGAAGAGGTGVTVAVVGDLQTHDGAAAANLAKGTNGQILTSDSTAATDLRWQTVVPNATASTDNLIVIANTPLGTETPGPLQFLATLRATDTGAVQTVGGNARGVDAVDLQPARALATQVASGSNAFLAGRNSTASGPDSIAIGGTNTASAQSALAVGSSSTASAAEAISLGNGNTASAASAVAIGNALTASGISAVAFGASHSATQVGSSALGGASASVTANYGATVGGQFNLVGAQYGVSMGYLSNVAAGADYGMATGRQALADKFGQSARSVTPFAASGDAQFSDLSWTRQTTDATANVEMFLDGAAASQRATVGNNTTWAFIILLAARSSTGVSACWEVKGGIKNDAGTVALVAAVTNTVIADGTGGTWGLAANFVVDADDPNNALRLRVTGAAATTIRWMASGRLTEVSF